MIVFMAYIISEWAPYAIPRNKGEYIPPSETRIADLFIYSSEKVNEEEINELIKQNMS